ncbi:MAG: UvrD-helicase domain-containing protein [Planctomycetota bacterium]
MTARPQDQDARRTALTDFEHDLVITAGAGTGKTALLTGRVVSALLVADVEPEALLVTTFTDKAATEMASRIEDALVSLAAEAPNRDAERCLEAWRERLAAHPDAELARRLAPGALAARARGLIDGDRLPAVTTFHAFCLGLLRDHALDLGLSPGLRVADDELRERAMGRCLDEFLTEELGRFAVCDEATWRSLLRRPGFERLRVLVEAYARLPLADAPPWVAGGLGSLFAEAGELAADVPRMRALCAGVKAKGFREAMPPALDLCERLAAMAVPPRIDDALAEALAAAKGGRKPPVPKLDDGPDKAFATSLRDRLWDLFARLLANREPFDVEPLRRVAEAFAARWRHEADLAGLLSHDDCLTKVRRMLGDDPAARRRIGGRFRQVLVDEFQDTDPLQYEILFLLGQDGEAAAPVAGQDPYAVPLRHGLYCIVGDPKQSIYRFRGADMQAFDDAVGRLVDEGARRLSLAVNFRSRAAVLAFVNAALGDGFIERPGIQPAYEILLPKPDVAPDLPVTAELLVGGVAGNAEARRAEEALLLAARVEELVRESPRRADGGLDWASVAMLFRSFTPADLYAQALVHRGVPVLVEGGRRFYERFEVARFLGLLRAALRPWDEAALLAFLRGPLVAATDAALLDLARGDGGRRGLARFWREPEVLDGPFAEARALLAEVRDLLYRRPPHEALAALLDRLALGVVEAASWGGGQRLANLERLVGLAATWREEGLHDIDAVVDRLAREAAAQKDAEESPLADPELNAVRLLTMHKAKGLEFETVVVPELAARKGGHHGGPALVLDRVDAGQRIVVMDPELGPPEREHVKERAGRHLEAEQLRLFYVALTRARRRVLLSYCDHPDPARRGAKLWRDQLVALGIDLTETPAHGATLGGHLHCRHAEPSAARPPRAQEVTPTGRRLAQVASFTRVASLARERLRPPLRGPSRTAAHGEGPAGEEPRSLPSFLRPAGEGDPTRIGTLVHAWLAGVPQTLPTEPPGRDELLSLGIGLGGGTPTEAAEAATILAGFLASPLAERLRRARVLGRELPMLYVDDDGQRWHGSIDLVLEEDGRIVVVDFKTDRVEGAALDERAAAYAPQLAHYAEALQRAWKLDALPARELWFLRGSVSASP